jgi:hypothetical protein
MMWLKPYPPAALDESAHEFISTFMSNVATVAGGGSQCIKTVAQVKTLLLAAIAGGSASAWSALYRRVDRIVATAGDVTDARRAHEYLQSFISENGDLARD